MSEDRLEKAIEAMKSEPVDPEKIENAQTRVRLKLENGSTSICEEFQAAFPDYVQGKLAGNRTLLLEDHLSRCSSCRTHLADLKGERKVLAMPERKTSRWPRWGTWAAIAATAVFALYLGRHSIDSALAPRGAIATVASVDGALYLVPEGTLETGSTISQNDVVRTAPGSHARLRLTDGSLVDINESSELSVQGAWSGNSIQLQRGDILVQAAKQHRGQLRVQTRDALTSVKGTVFAVSSGLSGTLVSVVEGSVAVAHSGTDVLLSPGEQESTNPVLESSVQQAIAWSPDAETYIGMLASLVQVGKQIAELPLPQLNTQSRLIQYMPPNMYVYGALPNLGDNLNQAITLIEQQAAENAVFSQWWDSIKGPDLENLVDGIQTITQYLGNEIVYGYAAGDPGAGAHIPVIFAEVQPGQQSQLEEALRMLNSGAAALPYSLAEPLLVASNSQQNLDWLLKNLGQGAASPFASEIAARYSYGIGWLLGIDIHSSIPPSGAPEFIQAQTPQYLFFDQRNPQGIPENEMVVTFNGPRTGLPSILSATGSGGAAEYVSAGSLVSVYVATREPQQMFEEVLNQVSRLNPSLLNGMYQAESALGIDFSNDLARAVGTEYAFSLESVSTAGPVWTLSILVNDSYTLEDSVQRLVEACNAKLENAGQSRRISYNQDTADGRTWTTLQPDWIPLTLTWTYDRGYMVAASDRGAALRAIATRNGGMPLIWSSPFQQQLPASAGLHPSGFAWLNTKGSFQNLAALVSNTDIRKLLMERDPILIVFDAGTEQIRAVSRTRLSSVFMDVLLLQGLGKTNPEQQELKTVAR